MCPLYPVLYGFKPPRNQNNSYLKIWLVFMFMYMPRTIRTICECGVSVLVNKNYCDAVEKHKWTEKHQLMLELKESDPESHKLALNEKTSKVKCKCGVMVCRWSVENHYKNCPSTARQRAISSYILNSHT